jgi:ACR3 family arsenite efflux pump ArsB
MSEIMQFLEGTFPPLILVFTLANLGAMGLQVKMPGVIAQLKNKKTLALIGVWGWVLRPAVAYLIAWVFRLPNPYVVALLLLSLAPCAPFIPTVVGKARGDVNFAGALIPTAPWISQNRSSCLYSLRWHSEQHSGVMLTLWQPRSFRRSW